jgi:hypothetical protein
MLLLIRVIFLLFLCCLFFYHPVQLQLRNPHEITPTEYVPSAEQTAPAESAPTTPCMTPLVAWLPGSNLLLPPNHKHLRHLRLGLILVCCAMYRSPCINFRIGVGPGVPGALRSSTPAKSNSGLSPGPDALQTGPPAYYGIGAGPEFIQHSTGVCSRRICSEITTRIFCAASDCYSWSCYCTSA